MSIKKENRKLKVKEGSESVTYSEKQEQRREKKRGENKYNIGNESMRRV